MNVYTFNPTKELTSPIVFFFDGKNARWSKEAAELKEKDTGGKLKMIDTSAAGFDLNDVGVHGEGAKNNVFVRDASGKVVSGVEAVHAAHAEIGFGNWFTLYRAPGFFCEGHGLAAGA